MKAHRGTAWPKRIAACALLALTFSGAVAQAPQASPPPTSVDKPVMQHFIGSDGLGLATVRRSHLEALWGRADVEKHMTPKATDRDRRHWALLQYPPRGLTFTTELGSYGERDPLIANAFFTAPFEDCTPQGLCIGMPQDAAMAVITAHYKITSDHASSFGNSGTITGRSYAARNKGWRKTHYMSFGFNEGRLYSMTFQLQPTPLIAGRTLRSLLAWTILLTLVVGGTLVLRPYRRQLEPVWKVAKVGFGLYALATLATTVFVFYILFKN